MILGPIVGVGGLAMLIPPSALAVVFASLAQISVGKVLIAGAVPGVILAILYGLYVVSRAMMNPSIAPAYDVAHHSLSERFLDLIKYILPLGIIFFLVLGFIFLGIATHGGRGHRRLGFDNSRGPIQENERGYLKKVCYGHPSCSGHGLYDHRSIQDL